jgi:hypothetical protein
MRTPCQRGHGGGTLDARQPWGREETAVDADCRVGGGASARVCGGEVYGVLRGEGVAVEACITRKSPAAAREWRREGAHGALRSTVASLRAASGFLAG